jgi:hypothetical protein
MPVSMMVPLKVRWLTMAAQSRGSAKGMERSICERSVSLPDAFCPFTPFGQVSSRPWPMVSRRRAG